MINAFEARERVNTLVALDEAKRIEEAKVFCEVICETAIREAVEKRQFSAMVAIPMDINPIYVEKYLKLNKYNTEIHVATHSILIKWKF
jgi:hypothetical protein